MALSFELTGEMQRLIVDLRARDWEMSAIARRFEEKGWADPFDIHQIRRHYSAIQRFVWQTEGKSQRFGTVNPYTESRYRLTPEMIAYAKRWIERGKELEGLLPRFYERGWLELGQVWYCWHALNRLDAGAADEIADAVEAFDRLAGKGRRQGWRVSADERRALELHAVAAAAQYFKRRGYRVENVGAVKSYDLECWKGGRELRVEVKGTTGDGSELLLTTHEVTHARRARVDLALFVLANIALRTRAGRKPSCSGGRSHVYWPWKIAEDGVLSPVGWTYSVG